jgi:hypothetical protein
LLVVLVLGGTAGVRFEMIERFLEKQTTNFYSFFIHGVNPVFTRQAGEA